MLIVTPAAFACCLSSVAASTKPGKMSDVSSSIVSFSWPAALSSDFALSMSCSRCGSGVVVERQALADDVVADRAVAVDRARDEGLAVHEQPDRLADAVVRVRLLRRVHVEHHGLRRRGHQHGHVAGRLMRLRLLRRQLRHHVDLAGEQRVQARRVVRDRHDLERVDVRLARHPVVRVLHEHALLARGERLELERARADRVLVVGLAGRDDPRVVVDEVALEIGVGRLQRDLDRQLVDRLQARRA